MLAQDLRKTISLCFGNRRNYFASRYYAGNVFARTNRRRENADTTVVKVSVFFDTVLLEEIPSPYMHVEFPLVPLTFYYFGIGGNEIPTSFVWDLKKTATRNK